MNEALNESLYEGQIDTLIEWQTERLDNELSDCVVDWMTDLNDTAWLTDGIINSQSEWLTDLRALFKNRFILRNTYYLLTDCLNDLIYWKTNKDWPWIIKSLNDRLSKWMMYLMM